MSLDIEDVPIITLADGSDLATLRAGGFALRGIRIEVGTLSTPDITIKEQPANVTILALTGLATDVNYIPLVVGQDDDGVDIAASAVPPVIYGRLEITTAGGGDKKTGLIRFLVER